MQMFPNLVQHSADAKNIFQDCECRQTRPQRVEHCEECFGPRVTKQTPLIVQHGKRLARKPANIHVVRRDFVMITVTNIIEHFGVGHICADVLADFRVDVAAEDVFVTDIHGL
jgi:hypothetical protein